MILMMRIQDEKDMEDIEWENTDEEMSEGELEFIRQECEAEISVRISLKLRNQLQRGGNIFVMIWVRHISISIDLTTINILKYLQRFSTKSMYGSCKCCK